MVNSTRLAEDRCTSGSDQSLSPSSILNKKLASTCSSQISLTPQRSLIPISERKLIQFVWEMRYRKLTLADCQELRHFNLEARIRHQMYRRRRPLYHNVGGCRKVDVGCHHPWPMVGWLSALAYVFYLYSKTPQPTSDHILQSSTYRAGCQEPTSTSRQRSGGKTAWMLSPFLSSWLRNKWYVCHTFFAGCWLIFSRNIFSYRKRELQLTAGS